MTKPRPCGTRPAACFVPGEGGPHGVGAIPQPAGFRGAAPGRGGCSVSSPGLRGQNEGYGAKMRAMGPAGGRWVTLATASSWYRTLLPLNLGDAPGGVPLPLVPPTPSCSRLILRQRKPGQAGSAPLGMWWAGAGMGAPRARRPSQLTAHPAGPFQPSHFFFFLPGKHEEKQDEHGFISRCFTRKYT